MKKCWCGNKNTKCYSERYAQCVSCHTLLSNEDIDGSVVNVGSEDTDLYGSHYWKEKMTQMTGEKNLDGVIDRYLCERTLYWLRNLLKYKLPGARSAEFGCGLGQFSYLMTRAGYDQTATELSPEICKFIQENLGIRIIQGSAGQLNGQFDVVEAYDVIEHVTDPKTFLCQVLELLKDTGILCLQTPCYDEELSFNEMKEVKPRFIEQMKDQEHVYLYSRKSIVQLLAECGFPYVQFEPAFFGDDYDMYLFASKQPIKCHTEEEITEALNRQPNGRLIRAMIRLFDEKQKLQAQAEQHRKDAEARLKAVHELEVRLEESEADRTARLSVIEALQNRLEESETDRAVRLSAIDELQNRLAESEADRMARLNVIDALQNRLTECETDRAVRLSAIDELQNRLAESEADRTARLSAIEALQNRLAESETDRAARLRAIDELRNYLTESEADRTARLNAIEALQNRLAESEADRAARLQVIEELQNRLAESEADRAARLKSIEELTAQLQQNGK